MTPASVSQCNSLLQNMKSIISTRYIMKYMECSVNVVDILFPSTAVINTHLQEKTICQRMFCVLFSL